MRKCGVCVTLHQYFVVLCLASTLCSLGTKREEGCEVNVGCLEAKTRGFIRKGKDDEKEGDVLLL